MEKYFAAANSSVGFVNGYAQNFSCAERIYIIKGGPGTGKSSLMRRASKFALGAGWNVKYYMCSSDPASLDGILMMRDGHTVGMLDGTSPHEFFPEMIGVREDYIDLGRFWERKKLLPYKGEISSLMKAKKGAFERAYTYLRACGNLTAVTDSIVRPAMDFDRLSTYAKKTMSAIPSGDKYSCEEIFIESVGMQGRVRLETFEEMAQDIIYVPRMFGAEYEFLSLILNECRHKELSVKVSHSPIYPQKTDAIFIEGSRLAFVISTDRDKCINLRRFIKDMPQEDKKEIKYASHLRASCEERALLALADAREIHFKIEEIYKSAMNFSALNAFFDNFFEDFLNN